MVFLIHLSVLRLMKLSLNVMRWECHGEVIQLASSSHIVSVNSESGTVLFLQVKFLVEWLALILIATDLKLIGSSMRVMDVSLSMQPLRDLIWIGASQNEMYLNLSKWCLHQRLQNLLFG